MCVVYVDYYSRAWQACSALARVSGDQACLKRSLFLFLSPVYGGMNEIQIEGRRGQGVERARLSPTRGRTEDRRKQHYAYPSISSCK